MTQVNCESTVHLTLRLQPQQELVETNLPLPYLPELKEHFAEEKQFTDLTEKIQAVQQALIEKNDEMKLKTSDYILIAAFAAAFVASVITGLAATLLPLAIGAILLEYTLAGGLCGFALATCLTGPNRFMHPDYIEQANSTSKETIELMSAELESLSIEPTAENLANHIKKQK